MTGYLLAAALYLLGILLAYVGSDAPPSATRAVLWPLVAAVVLAWHVVEIVLGEDWP